MRLFRLGSAISIIAVAIPAVTAAGTRIRPIHEERLKLSPADRQALVLEDLGSILKGPASTSGIATKPYLSRELGLCRRDVIQLSYAVSRSNNAVQYTPEGVGSVVVQYHYLGPGQSRSLTDWQKACSRLSGVDEYWASSAEGDNYLSFALSVLDQAVADVRTRAGVTLQCEDEGVDCAAEFLAAAPNVSSVWRCTDRPLDCYQYETGNWDVTIAVEYRNNIRQTIVKLAYAPIVLT
jgi:hypothetical protein